MATYKSLMPEAKKEVDKFVFQATDAIIKNTEREIKRGFVNFPKPPIKTGTLRRSIVGKVLYQNSKQVVGEVRASTIQLITSNNKKGGKRVEYAKYIEFGTHKMQPRPFMRNGVEKAKKSNEILLRRLIKNR